MELLQLREKEIFETLKKIRNFDFVVIGGYAVNAYTFPRFSVDCDVVVKEKKELDKISKKLIDIGYLRVHANNVPYKGFFERYEKAIKKDFKVSIDILIKDVLDRQTNVNFSSNWIFENSSLKILKGKTIQEKLKLRIIDIDALFVMKLISCRLTDIRDVFMLIVSIENKEWIKKQINEKYDLNDRINKVKEKINSIQFKDGLQGVFGFVDEKIFDKHKKLILKIK